jgi:hypothetical protein
MIAAAPRGSVASVHGVVGKRVDQFLRKFTPYFAPATVSRQEIRRS